MLCARCLPLVARRLAARRIATLTRSAFSAGGPGNATRGDTMNQLGRRRAKRAASPRKAAAERVVRMLVAGCSSPAEALELYYWSREPGLLEIIRGIAMMSEDT